MRKKSEETAAALRSEGSEGGEAVMEGGAAGLPIQHFLYFFPEPQGQGALRSGSSMLLCEA